MPLPPSGSAAPGFSLTDAMGATVSLKDLRGRPVILAFYPSDWSPVCGDQMALYNQVLPAFKEHGAQLLGISVDSHWCHADFASGVRSGVNGTPTFFVNGHRFDGDWSDEGTFAEALMAVSKALPQS